MPYMKRRALAATARTPPAANNGKPVASGPIPIAPAVLDEVAGAVEEVVCAAAAAEVALPFDTTTVAPPLLPWLLPVMVVSPSCRL